MADAEGLGEVQEAPADQTGIDLDAMDDQEIMQLVKEAIERLAPARLSEIIEEVQTQHRAKEEEVKNTLVAEFRERALQMGLSLETLFGGARRRRSDVGQSLTPKYRGPHGETWTGRGRQPNWLVSLEAAGHNKEEFRIKEEGGQNGA